MKVIKRKSCRAIIISPENRILLIKINNIDNGWIGWITPGGGMNAGENELTCLNRELKEELGLLNAEIGQKVWKRFHAFNWQGNVIEQSEDFYIVRTQQFKPQPIANIDDIGNLQIFHWWSLDEITRSKDNFAPEKLSKYLHNLIFFNTPEEPIEIDI